jgi:hypothetical protein
MCYRKIDAEIGNILIRLDGINTVMNAVLKRYSEQAAFNKLITNKDEIRDDEKKHIEGLQKNIME